MRTRLVAGAISLFAAYGCTSGQTITQNFEKPGSTDAYQDASSPDARTIDPDAGVRDATAPPDAKVGQCHALLNISGAVTISGVSECTLAEGISRNQGELSWPCGGGVATATYTDNRDSWVFRGTVSAAGEIALSAITPFDWSAAGCEKWESNQALRGTLASGKLDYTYSERVLTAGCSLSTCSGRGVVEITTK
jgi:hypothetical protein